MDASLLGSIKDVRSKKWPNLLLKDDCKNMNVCKHTLCKFYNGVTPELLEDSGTSMRFSFGLLSWNPGQGDLYPGQAQIPFSHLHQQQTVSPIKKQLAYY